ncbi:MAG: hypothetical protein JRM80_08520 [Nitrososphaerota archaeon]|nr:hypothetical protein [Nitrososphaerota archaeon]
MAVPSDYTIVGTVLALAIAILLLCGLALYVAFRLRETLRDEKGGSTRAVKVAFLVGLLFLSGGMFYFFASGFASPNGGTVIQTTSSASSSTLSGASSIASTSHSSSTVASTSTSSATSSTSTAATTSGQTVNMPAPSCAGMRVTQGTTFSCNVYIYDSGSSTFGSATLVSSGDLTKFSFLSCDESVNGGQSSPVSCSGNSVAVGSIVPNTIVLTLTIQAPSQSGQNSNCLLTLSANGIQPISVTFGIQVTA